MTDYKTVSLGDIKELKWAVDQADAWKGNLMADDYDEWDDAMVKVYAAVKAVERDRKVLRAMIKFLKTSEFKPDPNNLDELDAFSEVATALGHQEL